MRLLAILGVMLTGVAVAQVPLPGPSAAERLTEFRRNRQLLETLVDSGVSLAAEEDPLKRAQTCHTLADRLAREIQQAAAAKQGARAADLGAHLHALLVRGVAGNLDLAHSRLPPDMPPAPEMQRLGKRVTEVMKSTEEELERSQEGSEDMQAAIKAVSKGRAEVEKAAKGKRPAPAKKSTPPRK